MLLFISPKILGCGVPLIGNLGIKDLKKSVKVTIGNVERIGDDILLEFYK